MIRCLNKIVNTKCTQAWERWTEVVNSMGRAGRIMQRTMVRFTENQLVCGWERWLEQIEEQKHAGQVMRVCLV